MRARGAIEVHPGHTLAFLRPVSEDDGLKEASLLPTEGLNFFSWYDHEYRHSGIGLMTPASVHHRHAEGIHEERAQVPGAASSRTPESLVLGPPRPPALPTAAWINKPETKEATH